MTSYPNLPARYSKGTLKLRKPLHLPEGAEVRVSVTLKTSTPKRRKPAKRKYFYPTRTIRARALRDAVGMLSLGGDALADSEALYDQD